MIDNLFKIEIFIWNSFDQIDNNRVLVLMQKKK
jgi:hypothetical protein